MTAGTSTWKGLGMGLNGEYTLTQVTTATDILTIDGASGMSGDFLVMRDSDASELMIFKSTGSMRLNATTTTTAFAFDVRHAASSTTGWNGAGNFELTTTTTSDAQTTALRACLNATGSSAGGGREACFNLYYKTSSSAPGASRSVIWVDDGGTGAYSLLNIGQNLTAGASFWCGDGSSPWAVTATRAIRIYWHSDIYYIMVTSCAG